MSNPTTATKPILGTPNLNPTPKARFRSIDRWISDHRALVEAQAFDRAIDFAKLEYQSQVTSQIRDGNSAMAVGFRILGVEEFCGILKTLSEQSHIKVQLPSDNLSGNLS